MWSYGNELREKNEGMSMKHEEAKGEVERLSMQIEV